MGPPAQRLGARMVTAAAREASANEPEAAPAYVAFPDAGASGRRSLSPVYGPAGGFHGEP